MKRYKLRSGDMQDVLHFVLQCGHGNCENYEIVSHPDKEDVTLEFDSALKLAELKEILNLLKDNDLMLQTLAHLESYTGNYSR